SAIASALGLHEIHDRKGAPECLARGVVDVVVATEITGVVVRDGETLPLISLERNAVVLQQPLDIGRMMNDLVVAAELRKLVPNLMEAVGTAGDNSHDVVAIQRFDGVLGQHLIEVFVSHPTSRIAMT